MTITSLKTLLKRSLIVLGIVFIVVSFVIVSYRGILNPDVQSTGVSTPEPSYQKFKVLFLDSYSPTHSSYEAQEKGLKEALYPCGISYDVIYMDTKNYGSPEQISDFYEFFKKRMENRTKPYDGVIIGDDAALSFALKYQDEFFADIPMVFYGINNLALANMAAENPLITGFTEETYLDSTIDLAIQLLPHAKKIVAIYDDTATGKGDMATFFRYKSNYPEYEFSGINTSIYSRNEFIHVLESLSNDVILIYLTAFNDKNGNNYTIPQSVKTIVDHTHIPVFRNYSEGQGQGILGGTMMNFPEQCRMAGETMNLILSNEKNISEIPLYTKTSGIVVYDYELMKKFNLDLSKLPAGTVFYNKPLNYFKESSHIIFPVALITFGLLLILAGLIVNTYIIKSSDESLKYETFHDSLTGLHNHRASENHLKEVLAAGKKVSMIRIDIDNFKSLNETYGRLAADSYLRHIGYLLRKHSKENNAFAVRYSGDEFFVFVNGENIDRSSRILKNIQELFKVPMDFGMDKICLSASMGISNSDSDSTVEKMFHQSDVALVVAKVSGGNTAIIFSSELEEKENSIENVRQIIVNAIENDGIYMVYQPKIDSKTKEVAGYEALIRIKDCQMGPSEFIPIAERSGLAGKIGRIATEMAIKQMAKWRQEGMELKNVSVNYSCNQIGDTGYASFVGELLKKYGIEAKYFSIEITEALFQKNIWQSGSLFSQLMTIGVQIFLDDFGTGNSSLKYLTFMPISVLHVDKSLLNAYLTDGKELLIKDVIMLAHDLGKKIVFEGVEEKWQYERLRDFGADAIQGYYFSKPLEADDAANFRINDYR